MDGGWYTIKQTNKMDWSNDQFGKVLVYGSESSTISLLSPQD